MEKKGWEKLTNLKYIGEKSAKRLYAKGYRKKIRILREDPGKLAKIIGPLAYKIVRAHEQVKAKPKARERRSAVKALKNIFLSGLDLFKNLLFGRKKTFKLGIYGPTNVGKTTLANRISRDFTGEEMGKVSRIPHETKDVTVKKGIELSSGDKKIVIDLADTPGFTTNINQKEFVKKYGLSEKAAEERAMGAAFGVIKAVKWLDEADLVLMTVDATKKPHEHENIMLHANLKLKKIPIVVVANKMDMKKANINAVASAFPGHKVVGISAKNGDNMDNFYRCIADAVASM